MPHIKCILFIECLKGRQKLEKVDC